MAIKLNKLLTCLLLGVITSSCENEILEETITENVSMVENATTSHVIFQETFEGPAPFCKAHNTGFGKSYSFTIVASPVFKGSRSARFKLKATDPMISSGTRAEVTVVKEEVQKEMWYSFAAFFPADGYEKDSEKEIISQWHQLADVDLGEKPQSPATYLVIRNDRFYLDTGYRTKKVSEGVPPDNRNVFDLGQIQKDSWQEFVFHFIHSYKSDGLIEVWHNGSRVLRHQGGNMYNSEDMPKWKLGIYKWKWNGDHTTDTRKRIIYYDNIKVGSAKASFREMSPGITTTPDPNDPGPDPGNTFTFVNAETDQDIVAISKNAILTLRSQGTKKINIRANPAGAEIGSVKLVLKGTKDHTYIDNEEPYALFGDDGNGNYHYGDYIPAGSYTIKATPYTGPRGTGKAGTTFSITFTVKKY